MTRENLEIELKLLIDAKGHHSLLTHLHQEGPNLHQSNHFFDTQTGDLRLKRWALRCRQENENFFLTCKGPSSQSEHGVSSRVEIEAPTTEEVLKKLQQGCWMSEVDHIATEHLQNLWGDLLVSPYLKFHNERRRIPWKGALIELDHSTCQGNHRYEIEVEGDPTDLAKWIPALETQLQEWKIPFSRAQDSKMKWAINSMESTT